jgi:hypothetical protein
VSLDVFTDARVRFDLSRVTNSYLSLSYGLSLDVHRFVELSISARSQNDSIYIYVPQFAALLDREPRNLIDDLVDSFRFDSEQARLNSFFNIQSISVSAVHHLQDWELLIDYSGSPERAERGNKPVYDWQSLLEVVVRWRPIRELKREITIDQGEVLFDS